MDNRNLTKIFQQAVHIYALMQDLNTGEEQTVLANSLKKTTKLAESVLRDFFLVHCKVKRRKIGIYCLVLRAVV
ncbi:MAG: hypothetical protein K2Y01_05865 [Rhabdochlamydiaceae bacterium]|nr:hypothetical protein [Rhabdochlamydiaceae bacterium]